MYDYVIPNYPLPLVTLPLATQHSQSLRSPHLPPPPPALSLLSPPWCYQQTPQKPPTASQPSFLSLYINYVRYLRFSSFFCGLLSRFFYFPSSGSHKTFFAAHGNTHNNNTSPHRRPRINTDGSGFRNILFLRHITQNAILSLRFTFALLIPYVPYIYLLCAPIVLVGNHYVAIRYASLHRLWAIFRFPATRSSQIGTCFRIITHICSFHRATHCFCTSHRYTEK